MPARNDDNAGPSSNQSRPKFRDNDDVRDPIPDDQRSGTEPESQSEARGDARENIGNHSRGTAADSTGPEGNDNTRGRRQPDSFDSDLDNS